VTEFIPDQSFINDPIFSLCLGFMQPLPQLMRGARLQLQNGLRPCLTSPPETYMQQRCFFVIGPGSGQFAIHLLEKLPVCRFKCFTRDVNSTLCIFRDSWTSCTKWLNGLETSSSAVMRWPSLANSVCFNLQFGCQSSSRRGQQIARDRLLRTNHPRSSYLRFRPSYVIESIMLSCL
jgi:hypothetical protein